MQILIGCAKIMTGNGDGEVPVCTEPAFQDEADKIAMQLTLYSPDELQVMLRVNRHIAEENWLRYRCFFDGSRRTAAVFSYDGMVFRKLSPATMTNDDLIYMNLHLWIGSFLYGLLRPLDLINRYRLEGDVELSCTGHRPLFDYWKPILTDRFIEAVKADDGILVNLASNEFKEIFDWKMVCRELTVISPEFKVEKDGRLKTVVIYAKMCRGAMARWIVQNRISVPEELSGFEYEGFAYEGDWKFNLR